MPLKPGLKKLNLNLPEEVHNQFKAATASQGKSMSEVLEAFVRDYIRQHERQGKKGR